MRLAKWAPILTVIGLLTIWELSALTLRPTWLPRLYDTIGELVAYLSNGSLLVLGGTLRILLIGLGTSMAIAGTLAVAMAISPTLEAAVRPLLNALLTIPNIALIPVFIFIWGFGDETRIVTVVAYGIVGLTITWTEALLVTPPEFDEMAFSFGASRPRRLISVTLPGAAPMLLTGLRIVIVQGIKGVVTAEMVIGVVGFGQLLRFAANTFNMAQVYAIILIIIMVSMASYLTIMAIERYATRWDVSPSATKVSK